MSTVRIIDTTVFCEILRVPNKSDEQRFAATMDQLERAMESREHLLLPMVTIYETGNHIGQNGDGRMRRQTAERFVEQVRLAIDGKSPFSATTIHQADEIRGWLDRFVDTATQGMGLGDLSIIALYEQQCRLNPRRRVLIWSHDKHLQAYDTGPK